MSLAKYTLINLLKVQYRSVTVIDLFKESAISFSYVLFQDKMPLTFHLVESYS